MNPEKLARTRQARGWSLRDLADRAGLSAMVLSKYERGVSQPRPATLTRLASALGVEESFLTEYSPVSLRDVEYRTLRQVPLPDSLKDRIRADVEEQLEIRTECERFIEELQPGDLDIPLLPEEITDYGQLERVAEQVRHSWGLGVQPLKNLIVLLEQHGFRVVSTDVDDDRRFDGFSALSDHGPVIVLGTGWHGDRQRFTLAHELGHYFLRSRLNVHLDEEKACHRFAGALLVPAEAASRQIGRREQALSAFELHSLKHEWGLSMQAWVFRLSDLGLLPEAQRSRQWQAVRSHRGFREEPGQQYPTEQHHHIHLAVAGALNQGLLNREHAARLLNVEVETLDALLTLGKSE